MNSLRSFFYLEPEITFLNHGSFGATPRPVLAEYQSWQRRLEAQPVRFLAREIQENFRAARQILGEYLGAEPENLVFVPNATFGVNVIARSFDLGPGDEVLTSDHEYGACENVWQFLGRQAGFRLIKQHIPLPLPSREEIVEILWSGVSDRTRLIYLSQITSPTAAGLPIEEICRRAREDGIPVLIDGAHAPGQIQLDMRSLGVDFYTGNCHKWMLAPKGSGFLYIRPEYQDFIQPLVVSWGWGKNCPYESDSRLQAVLEWWGTKDPAAYFSVPAAIRFQEAQNWDLVRDQCRESLAKVLPRISRITGMPSVYAGQEEMPTQMGAALLPTGSNPAGMQAWMYERYRIEIPVIQWSDQWLIRLSVQGYNTQQDLDLLVEAIREYL